MHTLSRSLDIHIPGAIQGRVQHFFPEKTVAVFPSADAHLRASSRNMRSSSLSSDCIFNEENPRFSMNYLAVE